MNSLSWIIIILAVFSVVFVISIRKKRADDLDMKARAEDKLREQALDQAILNEYVQHPEQERSSALPFEVSYGVQAAAENDNTVSKPGKQKQHKIMLQIVEQSDLSIRKYMLDPSKGIRIGSNRGTNDVIITLSNHASVQCEIMEYQGKVYVRNTGSGQVITLIHGKQSINVGKGAMELISRDVLKIGNIIFSVQLVKMETKER